MHEIATAPVTLVEKVDAFRLEAGAERDHVFKSEAGQFFTPVPVATLMASMLKCEGDAVNILDAGAGVGSLFSACVAELAARTRTPRQITVTAFELDKALAPYLRDTVELCQEVCKARGIQFGAEIINADFIERAVDAIGGLFDNRSTLHFNCAILNPPYRKISSLSRTRQLLRVIGIETSNLYTGFLATAIKLIDPDGEMVAITPRSFCNGPYFLPFRRQLLTCTGIRRIHLFDSRKHAFKDDAVLQENIIFHVVKNASSDFVDITSSVDAASEITSRRIPYSELVTPNDEQCFIHIVPDDEGPKVAAKLNGLPCSLHDLGLTVSTGRVVDFRAREYLRAGPEHDTVPLIYPTHFKDGGISWPKQTRKPNALRLCKETTELVIPNGNYVLVKRFSTKEERKRIVAAVNDESRLGCALIGFENHLNYYHHDGNGISLSLAKGLACFLNSTAVDTFFRQFNGHTQVNATDLRSLRYPTIKQLEALGHKCHGVVDQAQIDALVEREVFACRKTRKATTLQRRSPF